MANVWVPRQHGAWAMLIVPFTVGAVLRMRAVDEPFAWLIPTFAAQVAGYLLFVTATSWMHAAPRRRPQWTAPLMVYGVATAVLAVAALASGGLEMLAWALPATPLAGLAIWTAYQRQDRSLASGFATVTLACGMGCVARFHVLREVVTWPVSDVAILLGVYGYFLGVVPYVKSLIRERGREATWMLSVAYHVVLLGCAVGAWWAHWLPLAWVLLASWLVIRAFAAVRIDRRQRVKPLHIGLIEVLNSVVLVWVALGS